MSESEYYRNYRIMVSGFFWLRMRFMDHLIQKLHDSEAFLKGFTEERLAEERPARTMFNTYDTAARD